MYKSIQMFYDELSAGKTEYIFDGDFKNKDFRNFLYSLIKVNKEKPVYVDVLINSGTGDVLEDEKLLEQILSYTERISIEPNTYIDYVDFYTYTEK